MRAIPVMVVLMMGIPLMSTTVVAQDPSTLFLRARATKDVKMDLDWQITNDTGVVRYDVYWSKEEFDGVPSRSPDATTTEMEYTVKGLEGGTKYYFLVAAVDSQDEFLAFGEDSNTPGEWEDVGHLKKVNYWAIMTFAGIITVMFLSVLWKIPGWIEEEKKAGGA